MVFKLIIRCLAMYIPDCHMQFLLNCNFYMDIPRHIKTVSTPLIKGLHITARKKRTLNLYMNRRMMLMLFKSATMKYFYKVYLSINTSITHTCRKTYILHNQQTHWSKIIHWRFQTSGWFCILHARLNINYLEYIIISDTTLSAQTF